MKGKALILLIGGLLSSRPLLASDCTAVAGEFELWSGWPPALRLTDSKTGITYGVTEDSLLPERMRKELEAKHSVKGIFCVKEIKRTTVPYQTAPIVLVNVISYAP